MPHLTIAAEMDDSENDKTRVTFTLYSATGFPFDFIVDLPPDNDSATGDVDVWVTGCTVEVGDTPADGFATFTPIQP